MIDMRRRNPREENTPPAGDRKARGARFLLELIENQKRHKALRNKGSRETSADECVSAARLSCTVQEKALSKEAASCSVVSQTCSSQTKLRREKSLTEISNFVSSATLVTMEATEVTGQEAERRTFVGNPGRSLSQEAACVPAVSPQRSRTLSGTRTRVTASTSRSPRTSSGSPSKTPPKRQQAHREQGSQTASSPRRSASHSPSAANHSPSAASHSPSAASSRSPRSEKRLAVTPPQFCRSKSDPSSKPAESTSRSPQKSHPVSPKRSRRSDVLQVKPLVNTYHVITERPRIRPRKGAPKDLQSRNVKEAFTWKNTSNSIDTPRSSVEVANTCTVKELKTLSANGPLEKARSETIVNGSFTLRSPAIHSIPPISVRVNHSQLSDVHSLSTGCIDRVSNLYDDLVEEYRMPSPPHCSKKHSNNSKPSLVSNAFHPPPCPRATSKGVAMYIPLRGDVSKSKILPASSAKPPRIRAYNRSEVLAFMKRKRLERRQTQLKGSHSVTDMTRTTTLRAAEEPIAVSTPPEAHRNFAVVEKRTPLRSTEVAAEVMNCARKLSEAAVVAKQARANAPEMDHFSKLLFNFDRGVSDILGKCGLDTVQLQQAVKRHTSTDIPVVDRLDKAMKQFESLLVKLGLRESRLIVEEPCTDASVLSWKTQFQLSPPRPKAIALQSNLQDTPRPQHARLRSPVELAVAGTTATCSSVGGGNKSSSLEGVEKAVQTESMGANPNFVYEWRDKYLVGGWHSSTPKYPRSTTQDQVLLDDLNLSHISCEVQNDKSSSAHTSSTPISEIDNSALDQARQVLRQLAASEKNIKSAQRVLDDIRVIEGDSKHTTNGREKTEERNTVKRSTEGRKSCSKGVSKSRNHKHRFNNSVPGASNDCVTLSGIEENDILEEAKRVLKELSENQKNSRSNSRTDVSRNLMESFDRAATEDSKKGQEVTVSKLPSRDQRERKIAPEALSCLVTNELDYLEDCNDALLKMSEVSRAQCYAFAKETSLANEFLSKDAAKKSMSSRADLSEPDPAVPAVGDDLVEELRRSLREAFDQIEQQSRDMSFLRRDMTASKAHDGLETVRQTPANTLKDYLVKPILHSEGPLKISDKSSIVPSEASSTTVDTTDVVNDKKLGLAVTQAVRSGSRLSTDAQRTSSRVKSDTEEMSEEEHHSTFRDVSSSKVDSSKEHRLKIEVDLSNKRQVRSSNDSSWVKQDSESVSQDTRSRSSEQINKSTKSSVSVSTVKTLNSKPEVVASPVRIKSASFSTEHDTLEKDPTSSDTLNKEIHSLAKTISTDDYGSNDSDSKTSENGLNSDEKLDEGREQTSDMVRSPGSSTTGQSGLVHQHQPSERPTIQRDGETSGPHHEVPSLHAHNRNMKTSSTALVSRDGSAVAGEPADPLVSALVDYMERGEKLWEKHRCEGFRLLKGVTSGLAATSTGPTAVSSAPGSNSNLACCVLGRRFDPV